MCTRLRSIGWSKPAERRAWYWGEFASSGEGERYCNTGCQPCLHFTAKPIESDRGKTLPEAQRAHGIETFMVITGVLCLVL